jgi:hypothetical protein
VQDNAAPRPTGQLPTGDGGLPRQAEIASWPMPRLRELGLALALKVDPGRIEDHRFDLETVELVLALTTGEQWARAAIDVALADAGALSLHPSWRMAAYLAYGQSTDVLVALLTDAVVDEVSAELWGCLLQEMVTRGADLDSVAAARVCRDRLRTLNHPTGVLPLRLLAGESDFHVRSYDIHRSESVDTFYRIVDTAKTVGVTTSRVPTAVSIATDEQCRLIALPMQGWVEHSNGHVEAEVFEFATPLGEALLAADALPTLPLECLRGLKPGALTFRPATYDECFATLFDAASNGGAYSYSSHIGGAHARASLWKSVAALVGVGPDCTVEEIAIVAERATWSRFVASTSWFEQVIWDVGIAVVREDRRTLAVLAATDTD